MTAETLERTVVDIGAKAFRLERMGSTAVLWFDLPGEKINKFSGWVMEELDAVEEALIQTRNESGQDPINFPPMLDDQLAYLYSHVTGSYGRPTEGAYQRFRDLEALTQPLLDRVDEAVRELLAPFNQAAARAGVGTVIARRR